MGLWSTNYCYYFETIELAVYEIAYRAAGCLYQARQRRYAERRKKTAFWAFFGEREAGTAGASG